MKPAALLPIALVLACSNGKAPDSAATSTPVAAPRLAGGFVSATVASFAPGSAPKTSIAAAFWDEASGHRDVGPCTVRTGDAAAAPSTSGQVRLDLGDRADAPILLAPDTAGHYPNPAGKDATWAPGTELRLSSAGAEVPAFSAVLHAPSALHVVEPGVTAGTVPIDRRAGLRVRWEAATRDAGDVRVALRQEIATARGLSALQAGVSIDCFFPRAAGTGTIPAEALADLQVGEANVMTYAVDAAHLHPGKFEVTALVNTAGMFATATVR
jgi:hypothetical protein